MLKFNQQYSATSNKRFSRAVMFREQTVINHQEDRDNICICKICTIIKFILQ